MNILLLGDKTSSKEKIQSYSSMQAYFLEYYFSKLGINVFFHSNRGAKEPKIFIETILDFCEKNSIDHILALGVNFFGKADRSIGFNLSKKLSGMVTQIHDGSTFNDLPIDLNFSIKDEESRLIENINNRLTRHQYCNHTINWAADKEIFYPQQIKDRTLRIFVDHTNFSDSHVDHSLTIFMNLIKLRNLVLSGKIPEYDNIIIKTLTDNGVEVVDLDNICVKPYHRTAIPAKDFAKELAESNIFFITHAESIGLCVLEAAMCGSLVFVPEGTINQDLLDKVNHIQFSKPVNWNDWSNISSKLTPEANSLIVQKYNWENLSLNILSGLIQFQKRDENHKFPITP